jgi:hypothetical protein
MIRAFPWLIAYVIASFVAALLVARMFAAQPHDDDSEEWCE